MLDWFDSGGQIDRVDRHIVISSDVFDKRLEPGVDRADQSRYLGHHTK
jgi:hypothetical protein